MSKQRKKNKKQPKEKEYTIKIPVYTTSMFDRNDGFYGNISYDEMLQFVTKRIKDYAYPLISDTRNKTLKTVINDIKVEEVLLGSDKALLLQISAYDTNFYDGYFEGETRINIAKNHKIGKESNYVMFFPRIKGLTPESYTCYFLMLVYEDPNKLNSEVSKLARLVAKEIIKVPIEKIKLPVIMDELKDYKIIPDLQIRFASMYESGDDVDAKFIQYLVTTKMEKKKTRNFRNIPYDVMLELINDKSDEDGYQTKKTSIKAGKTEYRISSIIEDAKEEFEALGEKIFNFTTPISQSEIETKIYDKAFILEKLQAVLNNYLSYEQ